MIYRLLDAALLILGAGVVVHGVAQWHRPLAWIVAGAALIALGLMKTRRS